jgi:LSD1 subclass zinc finger protein
MDAGYANLEGAYVLLDMLILKAHTFYWNCQSCRLPLFLPTGGREAVRATAASAIASAEASSGKKKVVVFNTTLVLISLSGWRGQSREPTPDCTVIE